MNIQVRYTIDAPTMAKASFIYTEKKPFVLYGVGFVNIFAFLLFGIMLLKGILLSLNGQEFAILACMGLWLFARKPVSRYIFHRKMKKLNTLDKVMSIDISRNGIVWQGEGIKPGHLAWQHVSYILQLNNGFIVPYSLNRFLWIPYSGFKSKLQVEKIQNLIKDKQVPIRHYPKYSC